MTLPPLIRSFTSVAIVLLTSCLIRADDDPRWVVSDAIATAIEPIRPAKVYQDPEKRLRAIEWLRGVAASRAEETAIVTALQALRKSPDGNLAHAAIVALGAREHREFIPEFFAEIEKFPDAVRAFFSLMPAKQIDPPVKQIREALKCRNPEARRVAIDLMMWTRAMELRPAVEKLAVSDPSDSVREEAATQGLGDMQLKEPKPAVDALLPLLSDPSIEVRVAAIKSLGRFKETRAVPGIRVTVTGGFKILWEDRFKLVDTLASIGNEAAADVLNEMLWLGYAHNYQLEEALTKLGFASSGTAIWEAYLVNPIHSNPGSDAGPAGYLNALPVLEKCADIVVFRAIRLRAEQTNERSEKYSLERLSKKLAQRFPEAANEPIETVTSSVPTAAPDRDGDGVPDRLDKFPDDPKQH